MENQYIEISRFTYFFENFVSNNLSNQEYENKLDPWQEIKSYEEREGMEIPLSKNFQDFWKKIDTNKNKLSFQTSLQKDNFDFQIICMSFPFPVNKIFIFETKIKVPISELKKGIEIIKNNKSDIFLSIIKRINPEWTGSYNEDYDFYYFFNIQLSSLYEEILDIEERNKKIVSNLKQILIKDNCIFTELGFSDKVFPDTYNLNKNLNFILENEEQPLILISPTKNANKLIIPDENLFIRCYKEQSNSESLPIKLVLKTILFQKAFIEYISTASINIGKNHINNVSYITLNKNFSNFIFY